MKRLLWKIRPSQFFFVSVPLITLAVLIAPHVFAGESGLAPLVEGAKKEGKVVIYSTMTIDATKMLSKGFEEKYPFLKAEQVRVSGGGQFATRILQEAGMKKNLVDVIQGTTVNLYLLRQKGLVASYKPTEPVPFRRPFGDSEGYAHPIYLMAFVVGYNSKLVPKDAVPRTYEDLLDPRWKGRIGMGEKIEWFPFILAKMGEEKGLAYMRRLAAQKVRPREGDALNVTLLAAGENAILLNTYSQAIESLKARGGPVDWVAINPTLTKAQVAAVASRAPHPNAARLYLEYYISKEGQNILGSMYRIPARQDVHSISPRLEEGAVFEPEDSSWIFDPQAFNRYNKLYQDIFRDIFKTKGAY